MSFQSVLKLLLKKSVKSLQLSLNEWVAHLDEEISASAYSQARQKFRHTAFIELLEKGVIDVMYGDGDYEKFRGRRLLALDATSLRLPTTTETQEHFGIIERLNGNKTAHKSQVEAKLTVLYDVLNAIPISAYLRRGRTSDLKASKSHLKDLLPQDIVVADRAYGSYQFFSEILQINSDFVIRCKRKTFERYHNLFTIDKKETIVEIDAPAKLDGFPKKLQLRFVRIPLATGEIEVLATSLLDTKKFPYKEFKRLYYQRWKVETFFHTLKSRLCIDNFTGKTVESIYQDVYATLFISGLESIITSEANEQLRNKNTKHPQQVNKAISFHTIKHRVIELVFDPPPDFEEQITNLFIKNPTLIRPERKKPPRKNPDAGRDRRSLYFQRYSKKHVF